LDPLGNFWELPWLLCYCLLEQKGKWGKECIYAYAWVGFFGRGPSLLLGLNMGNNHLKQAPERRLIPPQDLPRALHRASAFKEGDSVGKSGGSVGLLEVVLQAVVVVAIVGINSTRLGVQVEGFVW
jgi:hypothetical protein